MMRFFDFVVYIIYTASKITSNSIWLRGSPNSTQGENTRGFFALIMSTFLSLIFACVLVRYKLLDKMANNFFPNTDLKIVYFLFPVFIWVSLFILFVLRYNNSKIKEINERYLDKLSLFQARAIYVLIFLLFAASLPVAFLFLTS